MGLCLRSLSFVFLLCVLAAVLAADSCVNPIPVQALPGFFLFFFRENISSAAITFTSLCSLMSLVALMQNRTYTLLQDFCHLKTLLIFNLVLSVFTLPRQCPQTINVDFF